MSRLRVITTDKRHSHHHRWAYIVEVPRYDPAQWGLNGRVGWLRLMGWCVRTWGASQPVDINTWMQDQNTVLPTYDPDQCLANPVWSFSSAADARGTRRLRIYLRGGTELAWFRLAHGI
jgi:hypothetical protein